MRRQNLYNLMMAALLTIIAIPGHLVADTPVATSRHIMATFDGTTLHQGTTSFDMMLTLKGEVPERAEFINLSNLVVIADDVTVIGAPKDIQFRKTDAGFTAELITESVALGVGRHHFVIYDGGAANDQTKWIEVKMNKAPEVHYRFKRIGVEEEYDLHEPLFDIDCAGAKAPTLAVLHWETNNGPDHLRLARFGFQAKNQQEPVLLHSITFVVTGPAQPDEYALSSGKNPFLGELKSITPIPGQENAYRVEIVFMHGPRAQSKGDLWTILTLIPIYTVVYEGPDGTASIEINDLSFTAYGETSNRLAKIKLVDSDEKPFGGTTLIASTHQPIGQGKHPIR